MSPRGIKNDTIMVATKTYFSGRFRVRRGQTAHAGSEVVKANPNNWAPADERVDFPAEDASEAPEEKPVEQATAAPGEKRDVAPLADGGSGEQS